MSTIAKSINSLRYIGLNSIDQANSGHPGIVLGAAPMLYTLFARHMNVSTQNPNWINRDRFILAAGHGSALYYSLLHHVGYDVTLSDLKKFRVVGSKTPGHPELGHTPGVDATSGPLGQGIAMAVGLSIASLNLAARNDKINHFNYVLCGDGDLQEGVTLEAASLAGHLKLSNLIVLYDSNDIQLDDSVSAANTENTKMKFEAMGWKHLFVANGEDVDAIDDAIKQAKLATQPVIIEIKTIIGIGSSKQATSACHGSPLGSDESKNALKALGYENKPFTIDEDVYAHFKEVVTDRGNKLYEEFSYDEELTMLENHDVKVDFRDVYEKTYHEDTKATREISGSILAQLNKVHDYLFAGSADVAGSTKVTGINGTFNANSPLGRNISFGVREHAMGAICNGIVLHSSYRCVVGAFFVFSDYLKPAIRMAALMNIPSVFAFTHDSIAVGEDGPTHEPVEQLAGLRAIPNLNVFRPADFNETLASYEFAFKSKAPSSIILTRQALPSLHEFTCETEAMRGGYIVKDYDDMDGIIVATGSELALALEVSDILAKSSYNYRVVSMLSIDVFNEQSERYKSMVLPLAMRNRVAIEMGSSYSMHQFVGLDGLLFTIDEFGMSGDANDIMSRYGFEAEEIANKILGRN